MYLCIRLIFVILDEFDWNVFEQFISRACCVAVFKIPDIPRIRKNILPRQVLDEVRGTVLCGATEGIFIQFTHSFESDGENLLKLPKRCEYCDWCWYEQIALVYDIDDGV